MVTTKHNPPSPNQESGSVNTITRMRSSLKRPRAPIACIRCHHKKIRCDGEHPNCARCTEGGILCAYPSSRRSRNTPPASMDPFIDNLSQLEIKIHQIEVNLKTQRSLFLSYKMVYPAMMTKSSKKSTLSESHPTCMLSNKIKNQPQLEKSRKRSSPSSHSQDSKRQKCSLTTAPAPKIKTSSSTSTFPLSPSSTSSNLSKTTIPISNNEYIGHSPSSSLPQNYLSPGLDPFSCQTDWAQPSTYGPNNGMPPHVVYPSQPQQAHHPMYNVYQQRPLFLPQHPSPVTTPDYTDDSSGQFNLPVTSFPYTNTIASGYNKSDNDHHYHHHHHYSLSSSTYPSHTLSSQRVTSSSSVDSLGHIPSSTSPCPQTTSYQMIDLYNHLTMDDLISFDSQNTGMPLIENTVWHC